METIDTPTPKAQTHVPVLVVGAGPAGLVTAIGLARHGVRSLLIERHPSTSIFPRATGVSTRSMEIFRGWGLDEPVRKGGWRVIPRMALVQRFDDRSPVEMPLGFPDETESAAVSPTTAAVSPQDHLEPVLLEHYRSLGGDARFSTELVSFEQDADRVRATIRDIATGETHVIDCDYLVGADGHRSPVRAQLGIAMEGPDDLGQFFSILFRADMSDVLGERRYGLYTLAGDGPPRVLVPSGVDDRFVFAIPLPPHLDGAEISAMFPPERCAAMLRELSGNADLDVEILATSAFAFSAQAAERWSDGRVFLVGDAAHRMTPRGGRGMNTAIADAFDLSWKLAFVQRGIADPALLATYEAERGPIGRRNVAMSMVPGGGGSDDGLAEDLGWVLGSPEMAFPPDGRPGTRAPHAWIEVGDQRVSTLDLFGRGLTLVTNGAIEAWRQAAWACIQFPMTVRSISAAAASFGLNEGGAALVRPDGVVAWRTASLPADPAAELQAACESTLARRESVSIGKEAA